MGTALKDHPRIGDSEIEIRPTDLADDFVFPVDLGFADDQSLVLGTGNDAELLWSTADASNHAAVLALGASHALHVTDVAAKATDWNVSADTHPTLYVHSDTTPATDYLSLGTHDGTTGHIAAVGGSLNLTGVGEVVVNEASADVNFRVESNANANFLLVDANECLNGCLSIGAEAPTNPQATFAVLPPANATGVTANQSYFHGQVLPGGATTIPAGTAPVVASLNIHEPNVTATGTVTVAATVRIADAPTEGASNYALWVDSGVSRFDGNLEFNATAGALVGARTAAGTTAVAITGATALALNDSGGIFTVSQAAAYDIDLPSPTTGPGLSYVFSLTAAGANNVTLTVLGDAATFVGTIVNDVTSVVPATGGTLTFASGASALGDTIIIRSIATNLYHVQAVSSAAGGITIA